jgi:transketolase
LKKKRRQTLNEEIENLSINTIRTLSIDAVQKADSGHPGTPMALAPIGYILWQEYLNFNPRDPLWPNRDRFVLSCGHASMLLYSLLYLSATQEVNAKSKIVKGLAVSIDDIKNFRQLGSRCPGHPEYNHVPGVEATTGPLGQGIGNSVGMAIAERWMKENFNRPELKIFDYNIYAICSDGDLMEGISEESASIAGHLALSNLCWIYDNNHVTLAGNTDICFSEDVAARFNSYGWQVLKVSDANNLDLIRSALDTFKKTEDKPTLIIYDSHIGYGSPHKHDSFKAHGSPLGEEEVRLTKEFYGWPVDKNFLVPQKVLENFSNGIGARGEDIQKKWENLFEIYKTKYPELATQIFQMEKRELPKNWDQNLPAFPKDEKGMATRESSGIILNVLAENIPWIIGGSADLDPSTKTNLKFKGAGDFEAKSYRGRNLHYGIREHAMGAIANGLVLSKIRTFNSTFLVFSDYQRAPIRLSALMEIPNIFIYTHDSIFLGEDGPTHQPIEQIASLRAIPNLMVFRPADANEVTECWKVIMKLSNQPAVMVLTRQPVPTIDRSHYANATGASRGAYILIGEENPEVLLLSTGSEVQLCLLAYEKLLIQGISSRVISMPSWELFEKQSQKYRDEIIPPHVKNRVSVEAGSSFGWERYIGLTGTSLGVNTFGVSAPIKDIQNYFGFTVNHIVEASIEQLKRNNNK